MQLNFKNVDIDLDIIRTVKDVLLHGRAGYAIDLDLVVLGKPKDFGQMFRYSNTNCDSMMEMLFDLSLTSSVSSMGVNGGPYHVKDDNGAPFGVTSIELVVDESKDGTTNITPRLVEFLRTMVDPYGLERLKEPFRPKQPKFEVYTDPYVGVPIHTMFEWNIWDYFEGENDAW